MITLFIFLTNSIIFINDSAIINGITYIPKTIYERIPKFLDFNFPISFIGNGFGANWLQRFSFSSEYLLQMVIIDFGIIGLILLIFASLKIFHDNFKFINQRRIYFKDKFLNMVILSTFFIMIFKAASDLRNIPLAILIGFFYPISIKNKNRY